MYKYERGLVSIVEDAERTGFHPQTDRRTYVRSEGQGETSRFSVVEAGDMIMLFKHIIQNSWLDAHCDTALRWIPEYQIIEKSMLVKVIAWCRQATKQAIIRTNVYQDFCHHMALMHSIELTHWGRVTHLCVSKPTRIASHSGLSPGRRQAIIWNEAGILLIEHLGINFSDISIEIQTFALKKIRLKMASAKCRPYCLGINEFSCAKD